MSTQITPRRFTRDEIGLRPATSRTSLSPSRVVGLALHWPAMTKPLRGVEAVKAALRAWQAFHMDTNAWSDIGYQGAVDQDGNVFELRGLATRSGANGNTDVNERFGALLLILAPGEQPSAAMVAAVRRRVVDHRRLFPRSTIITSHGAIRPGGTECPGPAVRAAIAARTFEPNRVQVARARLQAARGLLADTPKGRPRAKAAAREIGRVLRDLPKK